MNTRYNRNHLHIDPYDQDLIKGYRVLVAGCGIGSYIAECLLRLGFENLTLIDGDKVELSNLNRQNYTKANIGFNKAEVLEHRLHSINANAAINVIPYYLTEDNFDNMEMNYDVAINALDFSTKMPFKFDERCCDLGIPIIHPYNLGWAGFVTVITADSRNIQSLDNQYKIFELNVGDFIVECLKNENIPGQWFKDFLRGYKSIADTSPPPQLSIGVHLLSGMVSHIMFDIATKRSFKQFPAFYYLSLKEI